MVKKFNKKREKQIICLTQIFILIIGIVAFAYFIGSEIGVVSADSRTIEEKMREDAIRLSNEQAEKSLSHIPVVSYSQKLLVGRDIIKIPGDTRYVYKLSTDGNTYFSRDINSNTWVGHSDAEGLAKVKANAPGATTTGGGAGVTATTSLWAKEGGFKGFFGNVKQGLYWAAIIAGAVYFIAPMVGASEGLSKALAIGTFGGVLVGRTATPYWGGWGTWAGIGVGVALFYAFYEQVDKKVVTFTCLPWQAPTGGTKCEECNKQGLPCTEYQCRSLGQTCELVNKGTDDEKCVQINANDVDFPTIQPWQGALELNEDYEDYKYEKQNTGISPPDTGVKIEYIKDNTAPWCIKEFTPLTFGITLNEPAKCKIDTERKQNFEDMSFFMSSGLSLYNHSYTLSLPGTAALESEGITVQNGGEYELAVKCEDANGNSNTADFVFKFCVTEGPDTTPPLIVTTDPLTGYPIAYDSEPVDINVYVNEPVEGCRWSHTDQGYENMENDMDCSEGDSRADMDDNGLFTCKTTLSGLKNREENKFYFRCKDLHDNENIESYPFTLMGSQPLVIDWIEPEDESTIKDSTTSVKVTLKARTSAGYNEGESVCEYSESCYIEDGSQEYYIDVIGEGENVYTHDHEEDIWINAGTYICSIRCTDLGGNFDVETTTFTVEADNTAPIVVRALHEETYLRLITNEPARCVYDTKYENYPCDYSFDDGVEMTVIDDINHYTEWNTEKTLYIKCEDEFGSQPNPDECSIIVRPSDIY